MSEEKVKVLVIGYQGQFNVTPEIPYLLKERIIDVSDPLFCNESYEQFWDGTYLVCKG